MSASPYIDYEELILIRQELRDIYDDDPEAAEQLGYDSEDGCNCEECWACEDCGIEKNQ